MKVALLGMMQSGKSSLLQAISSRAVDPGSTSVIEEIIPVPDPRLDWLEGLYRPKKKTHATIDCLDFPGVYFEDETGRSAARRQLQVMRTVGMIVIVVRAFEDPTVPAYRGSIDPQRDLDELRTELLLADLELVTTRIERLESQVAKGSKQRDRDMAELSLQRRLETALEDEQPLSQVELSEVEGELIRSLNFFTQKPIAVVLNVGEDQINQAPQLEVDPSIPVVSLCASLESELSQLDQESRVEFMNDLGIEEPAINKFVANCYAALGLISFLTVGPDEVRAWPIRDGSSAWEAAGKIHSDIQRGFIRAETMAYNDLHELGDEKAVKAAGRSRLEGKTYIVADGDIINFRFNV